MKDDTNNRKDFRRENIAKKKNLDKNNFMDDGLENHKKKNKEKYKQKKQEIEEEEWENWDRYYNH
jgi:hypothetical protein